MISHITASRLVFFAVDVRPDRGARPRMSAAELFGLIVSVARLRLPRATRCCAESACDGPGLAPDRVLPASCSTALTPLLGGYMARVYQGERVVARPASSGRSSAWSTGVLRVDPGARPGLEGLRALDARLQRRSSGSSLYLILRTQGIHPFNPRGLRLRALGRHASTPPPRSSPTPTGSTTAARRRSSYFSQMAGLAVQNFVSAAVGIAVLVARDPRLRRAAAGRELGNFWQDLTRTLLYILLPLSFVGALVLVSQGVIQTLGGYVDVHDARGRRPDARARPGRLAGCDQAARHQRRRLLQRQLARCRSRTRRGSRTSSRCCSSC